jgi:hypothetical protein
MIIPHRDPTRSKKCIRSLELALVTTRLHISSYFFVWGGGTDLFKESGHRPHDLRILEALGEDFLPAIIRGCGHGGCEAQEVDSQPAAGLTTGGGGGILLMEALEVGTKGHVHFARLNVQRQSACKTKKVVLPAGAAIKVV